MPNLKIETVDLVDLVLDPDNARKHNEKNLEAIAGSLNQFGQRKPVVIDASNRVVAGNGTCEAARQLGWTKIDIVRIPKSWDGNKIKAFALADNRTAELASWDKDVLAMQLMELQDAGIEIAEFGFVQEEFDEKAEPADFDLVETYEVVIECENEIEQQALLARFMDEGMKVRAIVV